MRLRVRHAEGVATLGDIRKEQSILALKQDIVKVIELPSTAAIQISGGYPPKAISDDTISVQESGLRDGDTLNVKTVENVPQETQLVQQIQDLKDSVQTTNGVLTLRIMDDDNSCLFRSIGYVLCRDTTISANLRQVIVERIRSDPESYSDVLLGQPRDVYTQWIQKPESWGGAIELSILSNHFGVEIDSIDVQTGRIDKFGEGKFSEMVLIVYSGIHYDALALAPTSDSPVDFDQTRFTSEDEDILIAAKEVANKLRRSHKYTDVANFTLRCEQCKSGLKGEKDAQNHATVTGHTNFVEYQ